MLITNTGWCLKLCGLIVSVLDHIHTKPIGKGDNLTTVVEY